MSQTRTALIAILAVVFLLFLPPAFANSTEENNKNASELGESIFGYMRATYSCQNYLGGLEMYRTAKLTAESIFLKVGIDKNRTVLMIQDIEDRIKAEKLDVEMEKIAKREGFARVDAKSGCEKTVFDVMDRVKLLQAKLGLL